MSARTIQRDAAVHRAREEATAAKRKLIDLWRDLENAGALREARGLGAIIARLEAWQNR